MLTITNTKGGGYTMRLQYGRNVYSRYCHPSRNTDSRKFFDAQQLVAHAFGSTTAKQVKTVR